MQPDKFYLGTHLPSWLERPGISLFISHARLARYKRLPRAACNWALDSGAFSMIAKYGRFPYSEVEYVHAVRWYSKMGRMQFAAPMDWMCEPAMIRRTGLNVREHQARTVSNYLILTSLAPEIPWIPVLQGYTLDDYRYCIDLYLSKGVDLTTGTVGLGSVCRRQATGEIGEIVSMVARAGIRAHGFGVKMAGLEAYGHLLESADSMAWSFNARRDLPLPGHHAWHKNCANCYAYACDWRNRLLALL